MSGEIYDPFVYQTHADPYPVYRALRDEHPVYHNKTHDFWALSRYDDVQQAVRNFQLFSSAQGTTLEPLKAQVPTLINSDPPVHTPLRRLIAGQFTPASVASLEPRVRDYATRLLEPALERGAFDIIGDFSAKLPMAIIAGMLGFPEEDEDMVRGWTDAVVHRDEGVFGMPEAGMQATLKLYEYFEQQMADRRKRRRDDIVQMMVDAEDSGTLSHEQALGYIYIMSIAGNETTTKLIGNMAWQLDHHPEALDRLAGDTTVLPQAIEEALRIDGPTHMMARTTTSDVSLHGQTIPAGAKVALLYMSANRDPRKFDRPDTYDLDRNPRDHLAFGGGLHACMGAALARLEVKVAWQQIFAHVRAFSIDRTAAKRMHSPQVRGFTHLPVTFVAR